jgi:hypothetical protein
MSDIVALRADVDQIKAEIQLLKSVVATLGERVSILTSASSQPPPTPDSLALTVVSGDVYNKVISELNTTIVPRLNSALQWVSYNMQDVDSIVDTYRREVETVSSGIDPAQLLLTTGATDKRIITPHVRTFFEDSSSNSSDSDE